MLSPPSTALRDQLPPPPDDLIPAEQIARMTGYAQPSRQLRELQRQGFWRARRAKVTGEVILERPHYDQVARGLPTAPGQAPHTPKLRRVK